MNAEFCRAVDETAKRDNKTKDIRYNRGRKRILSVGYRFCCGEPDVEYYIMCVGEISRYTEN